MDIDNKFKEALVIKHYTSITKNIFNFLAEFFGNKFYNIIYNLSIQYTKKNNVSLVKILEGFNHQKDYIINNDK